eukprot:scaffold7257_cov65-Phaeocystis_antarctica.AAC.3
MGSRERCNRGAGGVQARCRRGAGGPPHRPHERQSGQRLCRRGAPPPQMRLEQCGDGRDARACHDEQRGLRPPPHSADLLHLAQVGSERVVQVRRRARHGGASLLGHRDGRAKGTEHVDLGLANPNPNPNQAGQADLGQLALAHRGEAEGKGWPLEVGRRCARDGGVE